MAKNLIVPKSKLFLLVMSTEDMQHLTCICEAKRKNYYEVVEACFHAGLVALTNYTKCHKIERIHNAKVKNQEKNICPECGYNQKSPEHENHPIGE